METTVGVLPPSSNPAPHVQPVLPAPSPGLEGVVAADTAIGDVRGNEGFYHYRQFGRRPGRHPHL